MIPFKSLSILWLLSMLNTGICSAQNLVPNPSFEDIAGTYCGIMNSPQQYDEIIDTWISPTDGTPQPFFTNIPESCFNYQPESQYDGPIGIKGDQSPRTGEVLTGIWLYTSQGLNQRHYVQSQLSEAMLPGNDYVVEFYVSLADYMEFSINRIGAYVSPEPISLSSSGVLPYSPQVVNDGFVDNYSDWIRIADTIQVTEACEYITIGNFFDDGMTETQDNLNTSGAVSTYGAYYFIDDVRVEALMSTSLDEPSQETYQLFPSPVSEVLQIVLKEESSIAMYNMAGQMTFKQHYRMGQHGIDMRAYPDGQYLIMVKSKEGEYSERIIKRSGG